MNEITEKLCMGCMNPKEGDPCPKCGFDSSASQSDEYIKPGTNLDSQYIVGKLESYNGEGATYLGYDLKNKKSVWIREYYPSNIATRDKDTGGILPIAGSGAQYKALLSDFVELCNEVRRLSVSDPVVPAENMVGENNTIYVIYKYLDVITLEEYLVAKGGRISQKDASTLLIPLLNAVDNIHLQGIIHRGLSPYTILVDNKEQLYINAFSLSAARTGGSELKAEFFNGYSAPEQYVSTGWQGTWTDVYALATIFYRTISGVVPPKSTRVSVKNPLRPLDELIPGVSDKVSEAVENGMRILAQERTQTVVAFLTELLAEDGVDRTAIFDPGRLIPSTIPTEKFKAFGGRGDDYGQTEEISTPQGFQEFKNDFRSTQNQPPVTQPEYPPGRFERREEPKGQGTINAPKGKRNMYFILACATVLLVGAVLAVIISGKLNLITSKNDGSQEESSLVSSSLQEENSESSLESSNKDDDSDLVPNFIGRERSVVEYHKNYIDKYTFAFEKEYSEIWDKGIITAQSVKEGSKISEKGKITLTVSNGPHEMKMPDLMGKELEEALQLLSASADGLEMSIDDLDIPEPIKKIDDTVTKGTVLGTIPAPGDTFNPTKTKIYITVAEPSTVSESSKVTSSEPSSKAESSKETSIPERSKGDNEVDGDINIPGLKH